MAAKLFVIPFLCLATSIHCQQVPCMFVFGDSLFDNGNNNNLNTRAKVNYPPYGIDFPGGITTGRFSNGKNAPDFLGSFSSNILFRIDIVLITEFLGFDEFIPPFATANDTKILKGVNYVSGSAGILDDTGRAQGDRITMKKQLVNHGSTISEIARKIGNASLAEEQLKMCLYITNMGNNDYLNNYLVPQYYRSSTLYTPQQYAALLIHQYSQQLTVSIFILI
ncbi:hypothetical protein ACS0TY_018250 [Phlomoides rotata]